MMTSKIRSVNAKDRYSGSTLTQPAMAYSDSSLFQRMAGSGHWKARAKRYDMPQAAVSPMTMLLMKMKARTRKMRRKKKSTDSLMRQSPAAPITSYAYRVFS